MARVTAETVDHVARLARLSLTAEERVTFAAQLGNVLDYAEQLAALDTAGVEPMTHVDGRAVLRDDDPAPSLDRARVLDDAPDAEGGFFRVPRVIGG